MQPSIIVEDTWSVERRLAELALTPESLREAVHAGLLERLSCTDYDPPSARGYELWRLASRRLREVLIQGPNPQWRAVNERNQPLVVNPIREIAITVSSGNELTGNADPERPPSSKNPKGQVTVDLVEANQQGVLFPDRPIVVRTPKKNERANWILLIWALRSEARCELSLPRAMSGSYIVDWHERIMLGTVTLDEFPMAFDPDLDEGDYAALDVPVSRKQGYRS